MQRLLHSLLFLLRLRSVFLVQRDMMSPATIEDYAPLLQNGKPWLAGRRTRPMDSQFALSLLRSS
jgi:hypothetical protein